MSSPAEFKDRFYDMEWLMEQNANDPVVQAYMKDVDVTLLRVNQRLTPHERVKKAQAAHASVAKWRGAAGRREGETR